MLLCGAGQLLNDIQYQSRKRNLQRFLALPKLTLKVLWFPLSMPWIYGPTGRSN
jgi:hypothetical protein